MRKILSTLVLLLLFLTNYSQNSYVPYYQITSKAYCAMAENNYQQAIKLFEQANESYYPFINDLELLRDCYLHIGDTLQALATIKRMIMCGWQLKEIDNVLNDEIIKHNNIGFTDSLLKRNITDSFPILRQVYLQQIDWKRNSRFETLLNGDLFCRSIRKTTNNQRAIDIAFKTNVLLICDILEKENYPRIITDAWNREMLVISTFVHASVTAEFNFNHKKFTYLMSLLKDEVIKGNLHPDSYATIYDHAYWRKKHKSYFGRQLSYDKKSQRYQCVRVYDIAHVDERRAEIGLPPLWAVCKINGFLLPIEY